MVRACPRQALSMTALFLLMGKASLSSFAFSEIWGLAMSTASE